MEPAPRRGYEVFAVVREPVDLLRERTVAEVNTKLVTVRFGRSTSNRDIGCRMP